ncbi:MAG: heparan-alpha-glucosaminide N-acetyltransferase domain-containing protein [Anaerolineae bacterium]
MNPAGMMDKPPSLDTSRSLAVDQFRGLAIVLMVLANFSGGVAVIPAWLKHAPDIGLTIIDVIAPLFIFAIGLTMTGSWRRRQQSAGTGRAVGHFITRYTALVGIGAILGAGEILLGENPSGVNWGVLQAIGAAGLLTLPTLSLPAQWRFVIGLALLAVYQALLNAFWLPLVLGAPHGGLPGSLGWAAMLIMATALGDLRRAARGRLRLGIAGLGLLVIGLLSALLIPLSKNRVSASYVLVSLGLAGLLFTLVLWVVEDLKCHWDWLTWWGRNPLFLYIMHLLLLGIMVLPGIPGWYYQAPLWLAGLQAVALMAALTALAWWLAKRSVVIRI